MEAIDKLLEAINDYKTNHGEFPKVKISRAFWEENADGVAKLSNDGVDIAVVDNLVGESSFIFWDIPTGGKPVKTLNDLKEHVDQMVAEGKGDWPVVTMPSDACVYLPIKLYPVIPGEEPYEGFKQYASIDGKPEAEHILVVIGD